MNDRRERKNLDSHFHLPAQAGGNDRKKRDDTEHAIRGVLSVNSRAVGFISPITGAPKKGSRNKDEDIMIETPNLHTALNRDEVEVEVLKGKVKGRHVGKVLRVITRAKMRFVGTIEENGTRLVLAPDDFRMYAKIVLNSPFPEGSTEMAVDRRQGEGFKSSDLEDSATSFKKGGMSGMKALAEIKEWKDGGEPVGDIIKVLGKKGEHEVEMESIILERGFESAFPRDTEAEAEKIAEEAKALNQVQGSPIPDSEIRNRRDFRTTTLFTIDPANAKDFDDALSFRKLPNGNYEIGVHIADVSHYVREGTALDREARERGTSVYLVDRTIPMLPHALSNDLCSLNPNVDRLAFSALFEMDEKGHIHSRWFGKGVIHSQMRFTYETAQESIDKGGVLSEELRTLNAIAKKLRAEKTKQGAIDFEQDEVAFELDATGHPIRVYKKKRLDTHKLIEEFMLLANREVAHHFSKTAVKAGGKLQFIYRTHDEPNREKLEQLGIFVRALGHDLSVQKDGNVSGKDLQALFNAIEGHASESLIKTAAIRSMAKAVYSTMNIGHFGLAFEHYTHFTSPIRRYPDLLVHRSLFAIQEKHKVDPQKMAQLERMAADATKREISAAEAERESIKLKQVEYMEERMGKEFDGLISGVTEWGIYVEEKDTRSEGMVKLRDLSGDYFVLEEKTYSVVGERTKKRYSLGDKVRFKVVGADVERKTLDYKLV